VPTEVVEDYLDQIYLMQQNGQRVIGARLAERMHTAVPTVTETLRRMVREGRIPAHRFPGGREIRFHRDELIAWVKAQPGEDRSPSAADKAES